jgi:hypothetical protein
MVNPLGGFWSRLTPRERTYILVLVLTCFVMATAVLFYLRSGALRDTRNEIDAYRVALDKVYTRGAVYEERLEAKQQRESNIATDPVSFTTLLEEAQQGVENVTPSDQEELPPEDLGDGLRKRAFEFRLRGVTLEDMTKFLIAIESRPKRMILTEELTIRSPSAVEDKLNVDVKLVTWEREEIAVPADDEEEDDGTSKSKDTKSTTRSKESRSRAARGRDSKSKEDSP